MRRHYQFGAAKIAMYLRGYHDPSVSPSGGWRILKRLDMSHLPASERHKRLDKGWARHEKQLPGQKV